MTNTTTKHLKMLEETVKEQVNIICQASGAEIISVVLL